MAAPGARHDSEVARVEHDVVLRLDRATAEDLYVALYELGEHIAAGAPITRRPPRKLSDSGAFSGTLLWIFPSP